MAEYVSTKLLDFLLADENWPAVPEERTAERLKECMFRASVAVDQDMYDKTGHHASGWAGERSGSTGIFALVTNTLVLVGNVGDSRAILIQSQGTGDNNVAACALSIDHTPSLGRERARVVAAKGRIERGRVDGTLAVTRAFGDFGYKCRAGALKEQPVTAQCEVQTWARGERDLYLLLACDGIWDVASNQLAAMRVHQNIQGSSGRDAGETTREAASGDLALACADLLTLCLHRGSRDNMTAMLVDLRQHAEGEHAK